MMSSKTVLLAEDDADDQGFFQEFLSDRTDLNLLPPVENGVILMELLDSIAAAGQLPDAIILDQNMPKRNGMQTLALLKAHPRYTNIPVMVYSTYTDGHLVKECLQTGAVLVVSKPTDKEGYHAMIDQLFAIIDKA